MTRPGRLRWRCLAFPGDNHASSARRPAWALPVRIRFGLYRSEPDSLSQTAQASFGAGDLHQLPASTSHLQSLFGQANPIWKTVTVLLPSSPLESGAGMRNSYEFLCIRSTTCRKKNEKEKKNETRDFFYVCTPHAKLKHGGDLQETPRAWHCSTWRQRVSARRRWAMPAR